MARMAKTAEMTKVLRLTGIRLSALLYGQKGAQPMLAAGCPTLAAPLFLRLGWDSAIFGPSRREKP
jgi:hypothetical protein